MFIKTLLLKSILRRRIILVLIQLTIVLNASIWLHILIYHGAIVTEVGMRGVNVSGVKEGPQEAWDVCLIRFDHYVALGFICMVKQLSLGIVFTDSEPSTASAWHQSCRILLIRLKWLILHSSHFGSICLGSNIITSSFIKFAHIMSLRNTLPLELNLILHKSIEIMKF